jgi:hypothetical protein
MNQTLPADVERCLDKLNSELPYERRLAAEELGDLQIRDERIHAALRSVAENDLNGVTRRAAKQALNKLGYPQVEDDPLDLSSQIEVNKQEDLQRAANWYRWLWLSPFVTIPTLIYIYVDSWDLGMAILVSALWHLILLIPSFDKKSKFVRWQGRQALSLAGLRTIIPLSFALIYGETGAMIAILILIAIWLGGTLWGQGQAKRGDCSLMRWFGREEALPGPEIKQESISASELAPDALVKIIRYSDDRKSRRLALAELKKRDMVEEL